jgi:hypothetical protein
MQHIKSYVEFLAAILVLCRHFDFKSKLTQIVNSYYKKQSKEKKKMEKIQHIKR